jgi:hypothetical protein
LSFYGKSFVLTGKSSIIVYVKIDYLNRLLLILSFIVLLNVHSQAQNRDLPGGAKASIVKFYPNPATTVINFDFQKSTEKAYSLQIFSFLGGRKMYELTNMPERTSINISEFSRGVYIYQLRDKTGKVIESGKFQVSK